MADSKICWTWTWNWIKLAESQNVPGLKRPLSSSNELAVKDAQTITDVCNISNLPEVEIISLIEEQIPQYKLRADSLTKFTGYENQDWFIPSPALKLQDSDLKLTPDQIRETLNYFLLCSNRVSQMTKTYNDIEAVTRLLEEKEKDLELTARIGKELLQQNNKLETRLTSLEAELKITNDKNAQLSYDLLKKSELIQVLTNDIDDDPPYANIPASSTLGSMELMQRKIEKLKSENESLNTSYSKLISETSECEEKEKSLVTDFTLQLANANMDMDAMVDELERQRDENKKQHEEILVLKSKINDLESKLKVSYDEVEQYNSLILITKDNQNMLTTELADLRKKYSQVCTLYKETDEQLKKQKRVRSKFDFLTSNSYYTANQLQLDFNDHSLLSDTDSGFSSTNKKLNYNKVFETVRCASKSISSGCDSGSELSSLSSDFTSNSGNGLSFMNVEAIGSCNDNESLTTELQDYPTAAKCGVPGIPGASDLEIALRNLNPSDVNVRRAKLQSSFGYDARCDSFSSGSTSHLPFTCRTPESIMSTGLSNSSSGNYSDNSSIGKNSWRMPEKLQIIKPIEGSQILQHWTQLAQPSLAGLLEEKPGVRNRGEKAFDELFIGNPLDDYEEDVEIQNPAKRFDSFGCVYTYTNSTVLHPDDRSSTSSVTSSIQHSRISSTCTSAQSSAPPSPRRLSRRNSTCTFSTTLALAKTLNERELQSATISADVKHLEFTPTSTPCNSPCDSRRSSRDSSPEPQPVSSPSTFGFTNLLSSGAELFKRTFVAGHKSVKEDVYRHPKTAFEHFGLVDRVEQLGLENIMSYAPISGYALSRGLGRRRQIQYYANKQNSNENTPKTESQLPLGVPGRPGSDTLRTRIEYLNQKRKNMKYPSSRPDLGISDDSENELNIEHLTNPSPIVENEATPPSLASSTLGSLGFLLFGRKGGFV